MNDTRSCCRYQEKRTSTKAHRTIHKSDGVIFDLRLCARGVCFRPWAVCFARQHQPTNEPLHGTQEAQDGLASIYRPCTSTTGIPTTMPKRHYRSHFPSQAISYRKSTSLRTVRLRGVNCIQHSVGYFQPICCGDFVALRLSNALVISTDPH